MAGDGWRATIIYVIVFQTVTERKVARLEVNEPTSFMITRWICPWYGMAAANDPARACGMTIRSLA